MRSRRLSSAASDRRSATTLLEKAASWTIRITASRGQRTLGRPRSFDVRVLRQDGPGEASYWERHRVEREPDMNVISVLQRIAAQSQTADGQQVAPVAWDCNCLEEVCGACTMLVNGRVRQACTALVDRLLDEHPEEIELRPMSKFPVVRDLVVNRRRLFRAWRRSRPGCRSTATTTWARPAAIVRAAAAGLSA